LEQLRLGKSLYVKDGAFAPLLKSFLDSALEAELAWHLDQSERLSGNRSNGKIYLAQKNISEKWTMPLSNWGTTAQ
jgi:transposase-like protein